MDGEPQYIPKEVREHFTSTPSMLIEANSYRTRGKPINLEINGVPSEWHSLKGGVTEAGPRDRNSTVYEILFNPDTKQWLKTVPHEGGSSKMEQRLRTSVDMQREALKIAGLPELADEISECEVTLRGKKVYGFLSPHIGPSIEYYIRNTNKESADMSDTKKFVSEVYKIAYTQALQLYEKHGYWADDPNAGNILLHEKDGKLHVVLIDFSNVQQFRRLNMDRIPENAMTADERAAYPAVRHAKDAEDLWNTFSKQCENSGGQLSEELKNISIGGLAIQSTTPELVPA